MIWPGVQKPHWKPSCAMKAAWTGCSASPSRQALDGEDVRAVAADREREARIDPPPVDEDGAGAALPAVAALLGPGQVEAFAQQIEQRDARVVQRDFPRHAVHGEGN